MIKPLPLQREVVNKQGWIQVGAGVLLVLLCIPWQAPQTAFTAGGHLPQWGGFLLVAGLVAYLYYSIQSTRRGAVSSFIPQELEAPSEESEPAWKSFALLLGGIALILIGAQVLIPTVQVGAVRLGVPEAVIAASLVAFGTSLPELVTALNAVRRGHGELAVGNVIGADILNVLFVAGLSAAVTPGGLTADARFFQLLFPGMLVLLIVFRVGVYFQRTHLTRAFGFVLLALYALIMAFSYVV